MGLLARLAQAIAPRKVLAFEAGHNQRRLRSIPTGTREINQQVRAYGKSVLARSRYITTNNPYAANAKQVFISALVGAGIKPSSLIEDADTKKAVAQAWLDWTDEADADGVTDFYGLQAIIAAEMFEAGECFVRFRPRRPEDGLTVPLQLQVLGAEMLPLELNQDLGEQGRIQSGIQFGPIGNRTFYWFLTRHPGAELYNPDPSYYTIVPADQVLHLFKPIRAGQIRGIPHTVSAIVELAIHSQYVDAELERKRTAALQAVFVTTPQIADEDHPLEGGAPNPPPFFGPEPNGDFGLEPGAVINLLPGEDVKFSEPVDVGGNFEAFEYRILTEVAAGMGVPYAAMTGDLRQTSYGSIRAGLVEFRRRIEAMQYQMVFQFCRLVWQRWLDDAVLAGAVPIGAAEYAKARRDFLKVKWFPPKWEWIDPLKDLQAESLAVERGFKARSDVIEAEGQEPEETDQRIAADQKRATELGIRFDVPRSGVATIAIGEGAPAPSSAPEGSAGNPPAPVPGKDGGTEPPPAAQAAWPLAYKVEKIERHEDNRVKSFVRRPVLVAERVDVTGHDGLGRITGTTTAPVLAEDAS